MCPYRLNKKKKLSTEIIRIAAASASYGIFYFPLKISCKPETIEARS